MVVVHGIGEQRPRDTLLSFIRYLLGTAISTVAFAELVRAPAPGGHLLLGFFGGDDPVTQEFDHKVTLAYRWSPDSLAELLRQAGFVEVARMSRAPREPAAVRPGGSCRPANPSASEGAQLRAPKDRRTGIWPDGMAT